MRGESNSDQHSAPGLDREAQESGIRLGVNVKPYFGKRAAERSYERNFNTVALKLLIIVEPGRSRLTETGSGGQDFARRGKGKRGKEKGREVPLCGPRVDESL